MKKVYDDIFISFRHEDGVEIAEGLANILKSQGYKVFFDKTSIQIGSTFPDELKEAVEHCKEFIAVITRKYFGARKKGCRKIKKENDWVRKEIKMAIDCEATIIPIYTCLVPNNTKLPEDIRPIMEKEYTSYNKNFNTLEDVAARIKVLFSDETNENALIGTIKNRLTHVDVKDNMNFNIVCKDIVKEIDIDRDKDYLYRNLSKTSQMGSSEKSADNDFRFTILYTLLTYFRRMNMGSDLVKMVDEFGKDFKEYVFYDYVMNEYYLEKAKLSNSFEEMQINFSEAIKYAKLAIEKINGNIGIIHAFPFSVAMALEYGATEEVVTQEDIKRALQCVDSAIQKAPNYGGMYYSTKARLLGHQGQYTEALQYIQKAQAMEKPTLRDWMLRIANYQKQELYIRMNQSIKELEQSILRLEQNSKKP